MKKVMITLAVTFCLAWSACKPSVSGNAQSAGNGGADVNLECAALISAATVLMGSGEAENDPALTRRALVSSMTYLNAYAIPKGLKEPQAFQDLKQKRAALIGALPAAEVMSGARRCVSRSPL